MFHITLTKFYRHLVLETLQRARRGTLYFMMPGGTSRIFGGLDKELHSEIRIKNECFYRRWVLYGFIGLAESYLHQEWETTNLTQAIAWFFLNQQFFSGKKTQEQSLEKQNLGALNELQYLFCHFLKKKGQPLFCHPEYVHGEFFEHWLDPSMAQSAAYYQTANDSLAAAQEAKWERICQKLQLTSHDYVLDIGCGWGGFAIYAAQKYGCRVQATTLCEEEFRQTALCIEQAGLTSLIDVLFCDYKYLGGRFDKIVGIEIVNFIPDTDLEIFFSKLENLLAPQGILFLQFTLCPDQRYPLLRNSVDFTQKYITPKTFLPSWRRIMEASSDTSHLNLLDCEDITPSAAQTMAAWRKAFHQALPQLQKKGYPALFLRTWFYYLCYCEAALAIRSRTAVQAIYTRPNNLLLKSPLYSFVLHENTSLRSPQ